MNNIYSDLNVQIISFIGAAICTNDFSALKQWGLDENSIQRCGQLSLNQLQRLKSLRTPIADISVDQRRFSLTLDYLIEEDKSDNIKNKMINMQASAAMLNRLIGMDITEYRSRRTALGLDKASQGRPGALNDDETIIISQAWQKYHDDADFIRYYKVGMETHIPLNKVWAFMQINK